MSDLYSDTVIFILLFVSVGFGGIGVIGLLLFPDIRSRMYTAVRATLIGTGAMVVSVITYAVFVFLSGGGAQYRTIVIHALVLMCIVVVANIVLYRMILTRTKTLNACDGTSQQNTEITNTK